MPNNNPTGANGADDPATGSTSAAGLVHRQMGLTKAAPLPFTPGANAPAQARKRAEGGKQSAQAPTPAGAAPPSAPPAQALPYTARLAQAWQSIASIPGASPLVQQIAQEAQGGG